MGILQPKFFVFLLFLAFCPKISDQTVTCGDNTFYIQYPFRLLKEGEKPHHKSHHDQFILKCNSQGLVVLNLPSSGDFYVRDIDYFEQKIQLYDPGNCLPGRLKNLSLSSSPFMAATYQNYTFFSCPPESLTSSHNFSVISCLSNSTASILATSLRSVTDEIRNLTGCKVIYSLQIPVLQLFQYEYNGFDGDLQLAWNVASCRRDCKGIFLSKSFLSIIMICLITISIAILVALFCIGCCVSFDRVMIKICESNVQRSHSSNSRIWERARITLRPPWLRPQTSSPSVEADIQTSHGSNTRTWEMPRITSHPPWPRPQSPSPSVAPQLDDFPFMSSSPSVEENIQRSHSSNSGTLEMARAPLPPPWLRPQSSSPTVAQATFDDFPFMPSSPSVASAQLDDSPFMSASPSVAPSQLNDSPFMSRSPSVASVELNDFSVMSSTPVPSMVAASNNRFPTEEFIIGGSECISGPNVDSCPICLREYKALERLKRIFKCHHFFHADCLEKWLQRGSTCPICRTTVE